MAVRALYNGAVTFSLQRAPTASTKAQIVSNVTHSSAWHQRILRRSLIVRCFSGSGDIFSCSPPCLAVSLCQSDHKPYRSWIVKAAPPRVSNAIVHTLSIFSDLKKKTEYQIRLWLFDRNITSCQGTEQKWTKKLTMETP